MKSVEPSLQKPRHRKPNISAPVPAPLAASEPLPLDPAIPKRRSRGKLCPICGQRYGDDAEFCGADGATLVKMN